MALSFNDSASEGISYDLDGGTFDGPETLYAYPSGIASLEAFGSIASIDFALTASGIVSAEVIGDSEITTATPIYDLTGIVSQEALGTPTLALNIHGVGIVSLETLGDLEVYPQWQPNATPQVPAWNEDSAGTKVWNEEASTTTTWN